MHNNSSDEARKSREREHADHLHEHARPSGDPKFTAYRKWYEAGNSANEWLTNWVVENAAGKRLLDYGCGNGVQSVRCAQAGAFVTGIDISPVSIEKAKQTADDAQVEIDFQVMDAEFTSFDDNTFDIVFVSGVLHHVNLENAYPEIARILTDNGMAIASEALGHNPLINLYRKRTPYLRSPDEQPLRFRDVDLAEQWFGKVEKRYFNLAVLFAAPLWKTPLMKPLVSLLEPIDKLLLKLPGIRRMAWIVGFVMTSPKKNQPPPSTR